MASRPTKLFTSPDRQFGANGNAPNQINQPFVPGDTPTWADVPPDSDYRSHVRIERVVTRTADAPPASRPSEGRSGQLIRTPPLPRGGGGNGYDPSRRK